MAACGTFGMPSTPGARHVVPAVTSAGMFPAPAIAGSPVARSAPGTTFFTAAPSTLAPASMWSVRTTAVTQVQASAPVVCSTPASPASGGYYATNTLLSPQNRTIIHTPLREAAVVEATSAQQKILRIVSYRAAAGAETQLSDIMSQIEAQVGTVPGLLDFRGGMLGSDYTAMMVFQSKAALDKYRKLQRKHFFGMMKPFIEGPPDFDYQPPLATYIVKQSSGKGHVMSISGYKCADGKEAEWRALYDDIMAQIENDAVPGLVVAEGAFLDSQAFMLGLVLESQSHLDSYKRTVREQFLERMRPLMEDGPINEHDNEMVCPLRIEIA